MDVARGIARLSERARSQIGTWPQDSYYVLDDTDGHGFQLWNGDELLSVGSPRELAIFANSCAREALPVLRALSVESIQNAVDWEAALAAARDYRKSAGALNTISKRWIMDKLDQDSTYFKFRLDSSGPVLHLGSGPAFSRSIFGIVAPKIVCVDPRAPAGGDFVSSTWQEFLRPEVHCNEFSLFASDVAIPGETGTTGRGQDQLLNALALAADFVDEEPIDVLAKVLQSLFSQNALFHNLVYKSVYFIGLPLETQPTPVLADEGTREKLVASLANVNAQRYTVKSNITGGEFYRDMSSMPSIVVDPMIRRFQ